MRLPAFCWRDKRDAAISEKAAYALTPHDVSPKHAVEGHDSISLHLHNRTPYEFLALSTFGALHTGNASSSRIVSSGIPTPAPALDEAVGEALFGVRNTPIRLSPGDQIKVPSVRIQAATAAATSGYTVSLSLNPRNKDGGKGWSAGLSAPAPVSVCTSGVPGGRWKALHLTPHAASQEERELYALQSIDFSTNTIHILLLPTLNLSTWMSALPDTDPISSLCIPGTHQSCALYGWPISSCQEVTSSIAVQLRRGIRFLDIRLSLKGSPGNQLLYAYHGVTDEKIEFSSILSQVYSFLSTNSREVVIMSVKQENSMPGFEDSVFSYINKNRATWWLGTGIPKLGGVRGKIVLISRFGSSTSQPGGIHPPIWPDSSATPFTYCLTDGNTVATQDWYNISSLSAIPTKMKLIELLLSQSGSDEAVLGLNFTSGSSFPLALPPWVAKGTGDQSKGAEGGGWFQNIGVNALLVNLVAERLREGRGKRAGLMNVIAMDYFDQDNLGADLVRLMVQANFM